MKSIRNISLVMNTSQSWMMMPNCRENRIQTIKTWSFVSWLKNSKMQHYHEALNNAKKIPKDIWNLLRQLVPGKSKQNKCNFQNPTISASTFNNFFATAGEKTYNDVKQRHQPMDSICRLSMREHIHGSWETPRCLVPTRTSGRCNTSHIETQEHKVN